MFHIMPLHDYYFVGHVALYASCWVTAGSLMTGSGALECRLEIFLVDLT